MWSKYDISRHAKVNIPVTLPTDLLRVNYQKKMELEKELVKIIAFEEQLANITSKPRATSGLKLVKA